MKSTNKSAATSTVTKESKPLDHGQSILSWVLACSALFWVSMGFG